MAVEEFPHLNAVLLFPRQYQRSLYRTTERKKPKIGEHSAAPSRTSRYPHIEQSPLFLENSWALSTRTCEFRN